MFVGKFTNIEVSDNGEIFITEVYNNFNYRLMDTAIVDLLTDLINGKDPDKVYKCAFDSGLLIQID